MMERQRKKLAQRWVKQDCAVNATNNTTRNNLTIRFYSSMISLMSECDNDSKQCS